MRSAQRSVRAPRQHPQRSTRQVAARHRSADLPGQADGSHKPRAAPAALTPNHRRASASHSECSKCSECSECSLLTQRTAPRKRASVSEPIRVLRDLEISDRSTTPAAKAAHPLRHRSTRTLNPLADAPPHHASPISITTPHKPPSSNHRDATGAYLWHALLIYCTDRSTSFGMPSSVASVSHFRVIRFIRVLYCRSFGVLPSAAHLQSKTPTENIRRSTEFFWRKCFVAARDLTIFVEDKRHLCNPK